jgi:PTH1 family peptidyl-tRNA hydrolase
VGIGRPPEGLEPADFVLNPFSPDEVEQLDAIVARAAEAALCIVQEGGQRAMEKFNRAD